MEKNELLVNATQTAAGEILSALKKSLGKNLKILGFIEEFRPIRTLSRIYSILLEEPVSPRQTLKLLHVQLAALCLVMPADMPLGLRALFLLWTGVALLQCKR